MLNFSASFRFEIVSNKVKMQLRITHKPQTSLMAPPTATSRRPQFPVWLAAALVCLSAVGCGTLSFSPSAAEDLHHADLMRQGQPQTYEFERVQAQRDRDTSQRQAVYGSGKSFY
jgi:hypothetical protein